MSDKITDFVVKFD